MSKALFQNHFSLDVSDFLYHGCMAEIFLSLKGGLSVGGLGVLWCFGRWRCCRRLLTDIDNKILSVILLYRGIMARPEKLAEDEGESAASDI